MTRLPSLPDTAGTRTDTPAAVATGRRACRIPSGQNRTTGTAACRYGIHLLIVLTLASIRPGFGTDVPGKPVDLETMTISATRSPHDVDRIPSSVTLVSISELQERQVDDLNDALASVPGVNVVNTGATGGQSSLFIRGAASHQISLLVDGVRMNDRSASYINFLGGADVAGLGRLEVLRGPQSTLYGSAAMGGVVLLETIAVDGVNHGAVSIDAGSFDTFGASVAARGGSERLGFSGSLAHTQTDNHRPRNRFEQWSYAARIQGQPATSSLVVGATLRGQQGAYQDPGSTVFPSEADVDTENHLTTIYAQLDVSENLRSRLTAGWHRRDYAFGTEFFSTRQRNDRYIVDWQNTWQPSDEVEVVGGINVEDATYTIDEREIDDDFRAAYLSVVAMPRNDLVLTAGVRGDDFETAGSATTGRAGVAWRPQDGNTALRATIGTGFVAPGSADRFGVPAWGQLPNPDLDPERSTGWDLGVDHHFLEGRSTISATYFQNRFRDLFDWETVDFTTFEGRIINRQRATTEGVEVALRVRPTETWTISAGYTRLDARDDLTDERLARRPKHRLAFDTHLEAAPQWLLGAGVHFVGERIDGGAPLPSYSVARVYTSYRITESLSFNARVENAFDKAYQEVRGYAALPRAWFAGFEWRY